MSEIFEATIRFKSGHQIVALFKKLSWSHTAEGEINSLDWEHHPDTPQKLDFIKLSEIESISSITVPPEDVLWLKADE